MITYPQLMEKIKQEINKRIKRSQIKKRNQGKRTMLSLNIYASKNRKKSSIKCLKDKLRYIQGTVPCLKLNATISCITSKIFDNSYFFLGMTNENLTQDNELDTNCLDLYIMSEHVKKKTTQFTCLSSSFPWVLEHNCYLVKYWEHYMLCIVFYICLVYPYFIGIRRNFPGGFLFYSQIVISISLLLNVLMTTVTAVKTKKKYLTNVRSILSYRLNTLGFYLDLLSIIPFEYIVTIHTAVKYHDSYRDHIFYLCKGVKLFLVWRLSNFFEKLERKLLINSLFIKVKY